MLSSAMALINSLGGILTALGRHCFGMCLHHQVSLGGFRSKSCRCLNFAVCGSEAGNCIHWLWRRSRTNHRQATRKPVKTRLTRPSQVSRKTFVHRLDLLAPSESRSFSKTIGNMERVWRSITSKQLEVME